MKHHLAFWVIFLCSGVIYAQGQSEIDFIIKNLGVNVDGHFNTFQISAGFDANNKLTSVSGIIEVASIETGIDSRDEHLLEEDYFDVKNYPQIILESKRIVQNTNSSYEVTADLSIKGITKSITIPVSIVLTENYRKLESDFEVNRRDFNVGGGSFVLSKTVSIQVVSYQTIEE